MAHLNTSDMLSRRLFLAALRSTQTNSPRTLLKPKEGAFSLAELAGLSTQDKPATPKLEDNEFYDKYKAKLEKLKASKPAEYEAAVKNVYEKDKTGQKSSDAQQQAVRNDVKGSSIADRMKQTSASQGERLEKPQRPGLDSIINLELLQDKSPEEIGQIWSEYFSSKEGALYAVIPVDKYQRVKIKGSECPMLLCALPRDSGYEFVLGQCAGDDWYYTSLVTYQAHGEYAPYALALRYYTELADTKGLVLMKGEVASQDLTADLATLLVHETQILLGNDENFRVVEKMNKTPAEFKHMDVIDIFKKAGLF